MIPNFQKGFLDPTVHQFTAQGNLKSMSSVKSVCVCLFLSLHSKQLMSAKTKQSLKCIGVLGQDLFYCSKAPTIYIFHS